MSDTTVDADGSLLDLHNNFDFVGYEYRPSDKFVRLEWRKGTGKWVPQNSPSIIRVTFVGVTNLASRRRDDDLPFTEDSCLSHITFLPHELSENLKPRFLGIALMMNTCLSGLCPAQD